MSETTTAQAPGCYLTHEGGRGIWIQSSNKGILSDYFRRQHYIPCELKLPFGFTSAIDD